MHGVGNRFWASYDITTSEDPVSGRHMIFIYYQEAAG